MRTETAIETLERIKFFYENWVKLGHRRGDNTHNVSCTVSVRDGEWEAVKTWMWMHRESYSGIALFPYSDHIHEYAPFEEISEEKYNQMVALLRDINLENVNEEEDTTDLAGEAACAGGVCEI
jgi:ribonucleoside-diphosphate reductase alpha chain